MNTWSEIKTINIASKTTGEIVDKIKLEYQIDEVEELDETKSSFIMIECSIDGGKIWRDVGGFGWIGGKKSVSKYGEPQLPFIQIGNCESLKNAQFRIKTMSNKETLATYKITVK